MPCSRARVNVGVWWKVERDHGCTGRRVENERAGRLPQERADLKDLRGLQDPRDDRQNQQFFETGSTTELDADRELDAICREPWRPVLTVYEADRLFGSQSAAHQLVVLLQRRRHVLLPQLAI